ncbi:MAG: alpha/beta hydrolase [Actinobacteria bacterium]|nr:alpha/beta hydrolase [Actinomycetota bacterium]
MSASTTRIPLGPFTFDAVVDGPPDGDPVLLLHGFPQSAACWRRVQPELAAAGYRVVAPDLRGYSPDARPPEAEAYRMEELVGDVLGFADHLGWSTFHLVGHDWGGALAWQVAGRHGDRLRTLAVVSTPHPAAFLQAKQGGASADGDDQATKSKYMDDFRSPGFEDLLMADDRALLRLMVLGAGMDEESAEASLARFTTKAEVVGALNWYRGAEPADASGMGPVTVPTLYLWSTNDIALGRTAAEATEGCVDGPYRFVVLDGVSHWVPEEAPDAVVRELLPHLAGTG